jgi:hypothetical protein
LHCQYKSSHESQFSCGVEKHQLFHLSIKALLFGCQASIIAGPSSKLTVTIDGVILRLSIQARISSSTLQASKLVLQLLQDTSSKRWPRVRRRLA